MKKIIKVENLTKNFKLRTNNNLFTGIFDPKYQIVNAVTNVTFEVNEGESLAFLGPNGAGKTTTTKMLTGLMYPTSGTVETLGYTPHERERDFLMQIGLVMGNKSGLSWDLTGEQSFKFIQKIYEIDEVKFKHTLAELVELLNVKEHLSKQVRKLSLGERMKMELIASILHSPKVLFLDEPTIGLDITSKKNVRTFLKEIQKKSNITLVLTSHDMDDVEKVCDRVIVINKGKKVYDGDLQKLVGEYNQIKFIKVYFEILPDKKIIGDVKNARVDKIEGDNVTFEVCKEDLPQFMAEIVNSFSILDIDIIAVPLEEIIEDIFKKSSVESLI